MESSILDSLKSYIPEGSNWMYMIAFIVGAIIVFVVSTTVYHAVTPSGTKAQITAASTFTAYEKVTKLAPLGCPTTPINMRLCDYYMASSSYSLYPGAKVYDYISDSILPLVVKAGPRLVELDIYDDGNGKPVVGLKNQKLGTDYAYNTVPFEACCVSIANNAFNSVTCPVSSDPFILSLVFHTNKTTTINACAEILKTTCRSFMLDSSYSYQRKNLAVEPICNLQRKLIIVSGGNMKGSLIEELVNLSWSTSHLRRLTYMEASQTYDHEELIKHNRNSITMVVPDISSDLTNYNPQILFTYGCQWIMMNYGSVDSMMELYIGEFQENSLVLKPEALRELVPKKYKTPVEPDPKVSFQPMQKISPIYNVTV
jgi:hypothetical protein